uniref:Uncharacterized protein n=1 Tax=viral metagenome TaxID=1070528 RepID=A0A6C0C8G9_9ZZZZ
MEDIIDDSFISICLTLSSKDKICLTSTNKKMYPKRVIICYDEPMYIDEIIHNKLYHNFTRIIIESPPKFIGVNYYSGHEILSRILPKFMGVNYYCGHEIPLCILPKNVKAIRTNYKIHIPNSVTELFFGEFFNEQIDGMIPKSVRRLEFGMIFNQNIINSIPYGVTDLKFGYEFNKPIIDDSDSKNPVFGIPDSVITLKFGDSFNQSLEKGFPKSVERLSLRSLYLVKNSIIPPVKVLSIRGHAVRISLSIPSTVTTLKLKFEYGVISQGMIPNSVRMLFILECGISPGSIPYGVTHLEFGTRFNSSIVGCIPDSVIEIKFGNAFNKTIKKAIPLGVQKITFGAKFSCQLCGNIPKSVTHVILDKGSEHRKGEIPHVKKIEIKNRQLLI